MKINNKMNTNKFYKAFITLNVSILIIIPSVLLLIVMAKYITFEVKTINSKNEFIQKEYLKSNVIHDTIYLDTLYIREVDTVIIETVKFRNK